MDSDACDLVAVEVNLAGMDAAAQTNSKRSDRFGDARGAVDSVCRAIEDRQKTVAAVPDLLSAKASDLLTCRSIMPIEQFAPRIISEPCCARRRFDYVAY